MRSPFQSFVTLGVVRAETLVSTNWIPEGGPAKPLHELGTRFRLFVSPVVPASSGHWGAHGMTPFTRVWTTIVTPGLKIASEPFPMPTTLNSASDQAWFRPIALACESA